MVRQDGKSYNSPPDCTHAGQAVFVSLVDPLLNKKGCVVINCNIVIPVLYIILTC